MIRMTLTRNTSIQIRPICSTCWQRLWKRVASRNRIQRLKMRRLFRDVWKGKNDMPCQESFVGANILMLRGKRIRLTNRIRHVIKLSKRHPRHHRLLREMKSNNRMTLRWLINQLDVHRHREERSWQRNLRTVQKNRPKSYLHY